MAFELPFGDTGAREVGPFKSLIIIPLNSFHVFSSWYPWVPRHRRVRPREVVAALWSTGFV
jgi:hypothetical protein